MAASGFTPIQLYRTATASAAPSAGNLADGELAINTNDGKLFYKDNLGAVQTIATKATAALTIPITVSNGGTGLTTTTAYGLIAAGTTSTGNFQQVSGTGTSGQILTSNGAGALPTWQNAPATGATKGQAIAFSLIFGL